MTPRQPVFLAIIHENRHAAFTPAREPPAAWSGNASRWQEVLAQAPHSVMTDYTKDYRARLAGKCG